MAGTLYRSPAPGEPMFVKEGDRVTKGQTICIIEVGAGGGGVGVSGCWWWEGAVMQGWAV